jgi:2'-5' RNA ligase
MATPRLFVALELPDRVRGGLDRTLDPWRARLTGVRWGPSGNWHVTLLFLGATGADLIPGIEERLGAVARVTAPFRTALSGFGGFPSAQRASIVWAGLDDAEGHIARLATSVADALETKLEHESFSAHVTVGRAHRPIRLPPGLTVERLDTAAFDTTELVLVRSHLGSGPPRYETLRRLPLGAG